ncbi:MAG: DNA helicase [Alphaproteobacteria bacterium]|nr:MAG: DNA helicase [Alphaproteobacteria bacterium]
MSFPSPVPPSRTAERAIRPPDAPALAAGLTTAVFVGADGEVSETGLREAATRARSRPPIVCHAPAVARRLGVDRFPAFDLLELFAFVRPARFCLPTPRGLARALDLPVPDSLAGEALALQSATRALLAELAAARPERRTRAIAWTMAKGGWPWGPAVLAALGAAGPLGSSAGLDVWAELDEWSEHAPEAAPGSAPVEPAEARQRLAGLLGSDAEPRPQQADYASAITAAFLPRETQGEPRFVLAEAGTGVGKTLGYIAPASLWSEKNGGAVWVSTYTRNLQHQIDGELDRLYPDRRIKALRAVIRKGRENYLCLLNLEDAARGMATRPGDAAALGLMARWALRTRDGDMVGGDFPGWLPDLIGRGRSLGLADRRGECVYSACPHYRRCFIERSVRRARRADIVVANHALVMIQAALHQATGGGDAGEDTGALPTRYVFDEGHHLFHAADSAFSSLLSGLETAELRRWLLGAEAGGRASRARGLKRRVEDLIGEDAAAAAALDAVLTAAKALPAEGWHQRVADGRPQNAAEGFLAELRRLVYARALASDGPYGIEAEVTAPPEALLTAAAALDAALGALLRPMTELARRLARRLADDAEELDSQTRTRIEAILRFLRRRAEMELASWRAMLRNLGQATPEAFVDWAAVARIEGRDIDVGLHRHWVDPMLPFARVVAAPAHGLVVTSATLTDGGEPESDADAFWASAEARTGARHLSAPAVRARVPSPFDYAGQTRVYIVTDVRKDDLDQVAAAYRALFLAARGGGLGLFTAISRLKAVHRKIAPALEEAGLPLLAQHVDGLDTSTLVDIFRAEEDACLLGTDAVRDGVDVPGRSLRLIVFDRVPWARPDILHKARRKAFGGKAYDDAVARLRLKQAFGRLVRRADDRGVFVLLDPMMPSRLFGAFPDGVTPERVGLKQAVEGVRKFLAAGSSIDL